MAESQTERSVPTQPCQQEDSNRKGSDPLRICLMGIAFDNCNLGVGALADGAIRGILSSYPNAEISILDYGYKAFEYSFALGQQRVPVSFVNLRFSKKFYLRNNIAYLLGLAFVSRYLVPQRMRERIVNSNPTLQHLAGVDVVGSIAGGDSFSDIYGLARFLYVSLPQTLVLLMEKRLVLFPQTIGPFRSLIARRISKFIVSHAVAVYSRDYAGLRNTQALVGSCDAGSIKFCYDVGFLVEPTPPRVLDIIGLPEHKEPGTCIVGLNVSGLLYNGGYDRNNNKMFGLRSDYRETVSAIIEALTFKKGVTVLLIPHVLRRPGGGPDPESDVQACGDIYEKLRSKHPGKLALAAGRYNCNEIKYLIGMCDFFVGARMHACIAALSQMIPAVAMAYSLKFAGVMDTIGMLETVADLQQADRQEILDIVIRSFDRRDLLRQQLELTIPKIKEQTITLLRNTAVVP